MNLNETIRSDTYQKIYNKLEDQIFKLNKDKKALQKSTGNKTDLSKRIDYLRKTLKKNEVLSCFDAQVFESIVKKVIIGGTNKDGNIDPFKMTFVYKTGDHDDVESQKNENEKTAYVRENLAYEKANGITCGDCDTAVTCRQIKPRRKVLKT